MKRVNGVNVIESVADIFGDSSISQGYHETMASKGIRPMAIESIKEFGLDLLTAQERLVERSLGLLDEWKNDRDAAIRKSQSAVEQFERCRLAFESDCERLKNWRSHCEPFETVVG